MQQFFLQLFGVLEKWLIVPLEVAMWVQILVVLLEQGFGENFEMLTYQELEHQVCRLLQCIEISFSFQHGPQRAFKEEIKLSLSVEHLPNWSNDYLFLIVLWKQSYWELSALQIRELIDAVQSLVDRIVAHNYLLMLVDQLSLHCLVESTVHFAVPEESCSAFILVLVNEARNCLRRPLHPLYSCSHINHSHRCTDIRALNIDQDSGVNSIQCKGFSIFAPGQGGYLLVVYCADIEYVQKSSKRRWIWLLLPQFNLVDLHLALKRISYVKQCIHHEVCLSEHYFYLPKWLRSHCHQSLWAKRLIWFESDNRQAILLSEDYERVLLIAVASHTKCFQWRWSGKPSWRS